VRDVHRVNDGINECRKHCVRKGHGSHRIGTLPREARAKSRGFKRSRTRHLKTLSTDTTRDPRRFDAEQVDVAHWDAKSDRDEPRWVRVDVGFVEQFKNPVSLAALKADPELEGMLVICGCRCSR
jgi:hypothetical protein